MTKIPRACLLILIALAGCSDSESDPLNSYPEVKRDLELIKNRPQKNQLGHYACTSEVALAGHRVFSGVSFQGMTRNEVIQLLGKPEKSDGPDSPMEYLFDTGLDGWLYSLHLKHERVERIEKQGLD